jgi:hypothetical protein
MTTRQASLPATTQPGATPAAEGSLAALNEKLALALAHAALEAFGFDAEENQLEISVEDTTAGTVRCRFEAQNVDRDFSLGDSAEQSVRLHDISYGVVDGGFGVDGVATFRFNDIAAVIVYHGSAPEYCDDNTDAEAGGDVWLLPADQAEAKLAEERANLLRHHAARIVTYLCSGTDAFGPDELGAAVRRVMKDVATDPTRAAARAALLRALAGEPVVQTDEADEATAGVVA